jgi:hypothetical protein
MSSIRSQEKLSADQAALHYQIIFFTFQKQSQFIALVIGKNSNFLYYTFHWDTDHSLNSLGSRALSEQKFTVSPQLLLELDTDGQFLKRNRARQQSHLCIQIDLPYEANVQQNVNRLVENKIADHSRANDVSDDVVLMGGRGLWSPGNDYFFLLFIVVKQSL